jgi:hypothetical protein
LRFNQSFPKISGFGCFLFPCFATGCNTYNFKIATAAMRPRNDTKKTAAAAVSQWLLFSLLFAAKNQLS